jgi:hypothetical protein
LTERTTSVRQIEFNDQERRAVSKSLVERKARLIEIAGDTTQTRATLRSALLELSFVSSVLRKLLARSSSGRAR